MHKLPSGHYGVDLRTTRGGKLVYRIAISLDTRRASEARAREATLRALLRAGEYSILDRVREGSILWHQIDGALAPGGNLDTLRASSGVTLREACEALLATIRARRRSSTLAIVEIVQRQLEDAFGPSRAISTLTRTDARMWLYRDGWSAATQAQKHTYARKIFEEARIIARERKEPAFDNIFDHVRPASATTPNRDFFDIDETHALLARVADTRQRAFLACGFFGAMRISEASHLRWQDVDFDLGLIRIRPHSGRHAWQPKSTRGVRDIYATQPLLDALRALSHPHVYIFGDTAPLTSRDALLLAQRAFESAGLVYGRRNNGVTYHIGRHSAISNALRSDVPLVEVARYAGDRPEVILRTYAHIKTGDLRRFARVFDPSANDLAMQNPKTAHFR